MALNDAAVSTVSNENITSYAASYSDTWKTGVYEGKEYITCFRYNVGLTVPVEPTYVQSWLNGPNYGMILRAGNVDATENYLSYFGSIQGSRLCLRIRFSLDIPAINLFDRMNNFP